MESHILYDLKRVMIGLDFSASDPTTIRYTEFLCQLIGPEKLYFIHIAHNLDLPEEVRQEIYQNRPFDEYLRETMQKEVETHFGSHTEYDIEYIVEEGSPLPQLIHWSRVKDIDLMIVGRKEGNKEGSGVLLTRLARRSHCTILIVPQDSYPLLDSILVCTDFSDCSRLALEQTLSLVRELPYATVYLHHIYEVPTGYHTTGKSHTEFAQIMKQHAIRKYEEFMKHVSTQGVQIVPIYSLDKKGSPSRLIKDTAASIQAKLVVAGSRGRTYAASIFLGSFAEKLINHEEHVPLMVAKRKNETLGIIEAIQNL